MKLTAIFLLATCLSVGAKGFSQQITLHEKNAPLETIFQAIKKQSGYTFIYRDDLLQKAVMVNVDVENADIKQTLAACFANQPLTYEIVEKTIVVKAKDPLLNAQNSNEQLPPPPIDITGRITNKEGEPLAGASVIVKRTGKGDIADANGRFSIKNVDADDILEVSFVGYKSRNIKAKESDKGQFFIVLDIAVDELDRMVVQAYGKTSRRITTSDISIISSDEIERQPVQNVLIALQGKAPGLDVNQTSGYGSGPIKVELRGRSSIGPPNQTFPSDPLYIIDGIPLSIVDAGNSSYYYGSTGFLQTGNNFLGPANGLSPLFSISPTDIESIEVLKDADATAIYGSRGANGVILITTKKGRPGKGKFDFHIDNGITKVSRYWDMLNTPQYLEMRREAFYNDSIAYGITPDPGSAYDLLTWDTTKYTDWQKVLYGHLGKAYNVQSSYVAGNSQTNFRLSVTYHRTTDILTVSGADQRASVALNLDHSSLNKRLHIFFRNTYSYTASDMVNLPGRVDYAPDAPPIFDSSGNLNFEGWGGNTNNLTARGVYPFSSLKQPYSSKTNFLNSALQIGYQISKDFRFITDFGYNHAQTNQLSLVYISSQDPLNSPTGSNSQGFNTNNNWIIEPQLSYDKFLWKGHLSGLLGGSFQQTTTEGIYIRGRNYTSDDLISSLSKAPVLNTSDFFGEYLYAAVFGRVNYNIKNRYIININARRDGSSRFGSGSRFGNFGSVGFAWVFSDENWLKQHVKFLSFGKLRSNYGTTGSDVVGNYQYLALWGSNNIQPYNGLTSLIPTQHSNPNFHWQTNKKLELSLDLGLFKDRVSASITYYRDRCGNQLVKFPTPQLTGFTSVTANSPALVQNKGWEVSLSSRIIDIKNFKVSFNFNISANKNKLISYPDFLLSPYVGTFVVGQPLNIQMLLHYTGVDPQSGEYTFEDKNKNGQIDVDPSGLTIDDRFVYDINPKFFGGFGFDFSYKNLQLSLFFNYKKQIGLNALGQGTNAGAANNQPTEVLARWQKPGDLTNIARFTTIPIASDGNFLYFSDGAYTDASYVRLSNLSLSWKLPQRLIGKSGFKNCSLFFNTNNLFVITGYKGIDPETQNFGGLPPTKTLVGGLSFDF